MRSLSLAASESGDVAPPVFVSTLHPLFLFIHLHSSKLGHRPCVHFLLHFILPRRAMEYVTGGCIEQIDPLSFLFPLSLSALFVCLGIYRDHRSSVYPPCFCFQHVTIRFRLLVIHLPRRVMHAGRHDSLSFLVLVLVLCNMFTVDCVLQQVSEKKPNVLFYAVLPYPLVWVLKETSLSWTHSIAEMVYRL